MNGYLKEYYKQGVIAKESPTQQSGKLHTESIAQPLSKNATETAPHSPVQLQQASPPTKKSTGLQSKQDTSEKATPPYSPKTVCLDATAVEFYPPTTPQQTTSYLPNLSEAPINPQFQQQSDVWKTIAQVIKEGPSLPKVELMKFGGDPLEYAEFVTNFRVKSSIGRIPEIHSFASAMHW